MPGGLEDTSESQRKPATAVEVADGLRSNQLLQRARIGLVHGRLSAADRTEQMRLFANAELDVLVATTVIEVGVDIPNATTMVILDADRFGLAQLHQLRGRVGRGIKSGLCLLVSHATHGAAVQRLEAMLQTSDGFTLSELDLELRGEGDVLGELQSGGRSRLKLLRVVRDAEIIEEARKLAADLVSKPLPEPILRAIDPELSAAIQRG
jgi:ATP-dependent DNA helicase RecG